MQTSLQMITEKKRNKLCVIVETGDASLIKHNTSDCFLPQIHSGLPRPAVKGPREKSVQGQIRGTWVKVARFDSVQNSIGVKASPLNAEEGVFLKVEGALFKKKLYKK